MLFYLLTLIINPAFTHGCHVAATHFILGFAAEQLNAGIFLP